MGDQMSVVRRITGETVGGKIRFANMVFAIVGCAFIWFGGLDHYDWSGTVFFGVITLNFLVSVGFDLVKAHRDGIRFWPRIGGPEDLDRPGGPYDHLHGRVKGDFRS
jgi:hypothetical protein